MNYVIYVPEKDTTIVFYEGTGDNLLPEDMEKGLNDYVNMAVYNGKLTPRAFSFLVKQGKIEYIDDNDYEQYVGDSMYMFNNEKEPYCGYDSDSLPYILGYELAADWFDNEKLTNVIYLGVFSDDGELVFNFHETLEDHRPKKFTIAYAVTGGFEIEAMSYDEANEIAEEKIETMPWEDLFGSNGVQITEVIES